MRDRRYVTVIVILASLAVLVAGLIIGDTAAVWQRAATVCLECIGIG